MTTNRWVHLITFLVLGLLVACSDESNSDPTDARQATHTLGEGQVTSAPATDIPQPTRSEALLGSPKEPSPTPFPNPAPTLVPAGPPVDASGGFYFGPDAKWPDYIPADIPVLEGEIHTLMEAPGSHVRMLYGNISEEQIFEYLGVLEKEGFDLQGIVYTVPGFPDRSEEKLARGEFDAVDISRGAYRMRLEYGAGEASYDIYTAAFLPAPERTTPTAASIQWPEDVANLAPPPDDCPLTALVRLNPDGYQITCARAAEDTVDNYVAALMSLGFSEQDRLVNDRGDLVILTLAKGSETLELSPLFTGDLIIDIRPDVKWPEAITHLAPPPERCRLSASYELATGSYHIACSQEGDGVVDAYAAVLQSLGYAEQTRLLGAAGELTLLKLEKADATVTLWPGPTGDLAIEIKPGAP